MLTEDTIIASITVLQLGNLIVCRADRVLRDGVVISSTPRVHDYAPGDDLTGEDDAVLRLAAAAWTPEVLQGYADHLAEGALALEAAYASGATEQVPL
jgi:hypothetical protein